MATVDEAAEKAKQKGFRSYLVPCFLAFHFSIIASGIWMPELAKFPALAWPRNIYQILSGAGGSFGFFSPNIGNQALVVFEIDDRDRISLQDLVTPEVSLRLGNMYRTFIDAYGDTKLRRSVAASLSAEVFRRFPNSQKVTMIVSIFSLPSLREYGAGLRPSIKEIYRASFTVGDKK